MVLHKAIKNLITGEVQYDSLHKQAECKPMHCTKELCSGSTMDLYQKAPKEIPKEEVRRKAKDFIAQFYSPESGRLGEFAARSAQIESEIETQGYYSLTSEELEYGAKLAWRNAPRCPGRIQWKNLKLFDNRSLTSLDDVFSSLCTHIEYSTNGGSIRPAISVYRERRPSREGGGGGANDKFRIWNKQLLAYAGHEQEDGSVIGDKGGVVFTKFCKRLGWAGTNGNFDILPLVLSDENHSPTLYDIPEEIIKRVKIVHPEFPSIGTLNLEWFALPAVSACLFEVGGLQFPMAPFSGWYSLPEIATRDIMDKQRYDMLEIVAKTLGYDTTSTINLWKDKANTEMNIAVLHSFNRDNVSIVDHHTQAEQFMVHFQQEHESRGGCPADWVWVVPPEAGSLTTVYHQEMLNYHLTPSYDAQDDLVQSYRFPEDRGSMSLKSALKAIYFCGYLLSKQLKKRPKAVVYYGTETGTSKRHAESLYELLSYKYFVQIRNISKCTLETLDQIQETTTVFFISSTFGNGDPPTDAKPFALQIKKHLESGEQKMFKSLSFSVLGLGSSAYPHFGSFGTYLDKSLFQLGGKRVVSLMICDELSQPEKTFKRWVGQLREAGLMDAGIEKKVEAKERVEKRRIFRRISTDNNEFFRSLKMFEGKAPFFARLISRTEFGNSERFFLTKMQVVGRNRTAASAANFQTGDHIAIFPKNHPDLVKKLIEKVLEVSEENRILRQRGLESKNSVGSVEEMLTSYYDITSVPSQAALGKLVPFATSSKDRDKLQLLSSDPELYDHWHAHSGHGILEVLNEYPSIEITLTNLIEILDTMRPRWYSLASSPLAMNNNNNNDDEGGVTFDLILSQVKYETPVGTIRKGLCSNFLLDLKMNSMVTCCHRQINSLQQAVADAGRKPLVMIAAGSGIAPFRAVWQELKSRPGLQKENNLLFFGCRDETENILEPETRDLLTRVPAFSRQPGQPKKYVQDVVEEHGKSIVDLVWRKAGFVLVCGTVTMAQSVRDKLSDIFVAQTGKSLIQVNELLEEMKLENRYVEEIFGLHA